MDKQLLTVSEAALMLGVSPATVRRMVDSGMIYGWRIPSTGKHRRIPLTEVLRLVGTRILEQEERTT
jgi:excisionase family DNA binding protein